ncbi:hypothetical protein BDR05DRAFT_1005133 [Suillus weaverae]|nr:hypothetical protein BDR05DRAFT_1005133 [Suillus weaverae]
MAPSRKRKFDKYQRQFIAENLANAAQRAAAAGHDDAGPGTSYHTHMSVDVTNRLHPLAKMTYFSVPNVISPATNYVPSTLISIPSESETDFVIEDTYIDYIVDTNFNPEPVRKTSKCSPGGSVFEYYQALSRLTDNTGTKRPKDRYESLLCMSHQYRHLIALKRAGRAHDISGILGTTLGELAVVCPACPQPGKNLPSDWADAPQDKQWLYSLFVEEADPSFSEGWAYFIEESGFKSVLDTHVGLTQEKSSCASHNAVNLADSKRVCGLAATGIGAVVCTRHNFKRPSAVGDLQKGEKYVNMDYLFFSTMTHSSELVVINVSYDIACAHATEIQLSTLQQRTNTLCCRIEHWIKIQTLYMPCVARLHEMIDATSDNTEEDVHSIKLWMPSAIVTQSLSCDRNLLLIEWKVRRAQGHEALHELHQHLQLKCHLTGFKKAWITSQRGHTRSRGIIDTVQKKIDTAATKYCIAWASLSALAEPLLEIERKAEFLVLEKEDVCGMTEDQAAGESISEGRRLISISWIGKQCYGTGEEELSDGKLASLPSHHAILLSNGICFFL